MKGIVNDHQETARAVQGFLWEGIPNKSELRKHTPEEYHEFLVAIWKDSWNSYDSGARELGWKD